MSDNTSSIEAIEKMTPFWRAVWTFGKSFMVILWFCIPIGADFLYVKWASEAQGLGFVHGLGYYIPNFLLFAMALGFDALAIARALGWGRGEKTPTPQPFYTVDPPSNPQTPERPQQS